VLCCVEKLAPDGRAITIGRPLANAEAYILDARLQPVPVGVPGELCIAGDGLARGYRNRPRLTAERFVPHAFSPLPGRRMYRTGDRARWTDDGRIDWLGRTDRQVKLRGQRIELGEIEAALRGHPGVGDCAVVACAMDSATAHLAACIVPSAGASVDPASLRAWLARWLPAYMLPSRIVAMERLPHTASGKVDYLSLPPPRVEATGARRPREAGPVAAAVIEVWQASLRQPGIGPDDDFFLLGGHSLLAAIVASRLSAAFDIELPVRCLFETPTAAGLAATIAELKARGTMRPAPPPIRRRQRYRPPPTGTNAPVT
jgi:acyl carrier protein